MVTLPSGQQVEAEALAGVDLALVHRRIKDIVRTLENFKQMRGEGRSRADYVEQASRGRGRGRGLPRARGRWHAADVWQDKEARLPAWLACALPPTRNDTHTRTNNNNNHTFFLPSPLPPLLQLKRDLCTYYSYNQFMVDTLLAMFSVGEALELIEANEVRQKDRNKNDDCAPVCTHLHTPAHTCVCG